MSVEDKSKIVENPVYFEGICFTVQGAVSVILSLFLLYIIRTGLEGTVQNTTIITLAGFLIIFILGIYSLIRGIFQLFFKYYFDFNLLLGLVKKEKYSYRMKYTLNEIVGILKNNSPLFQMDTKGTTQHLLESIYPGLMGMPGYVKNVAGATFNRVLLSVGILISFFIGVASSLFFANESDRMLSLNYVGWITAILLFLQWIDFRKYRRTSGIVVDRNKIANVVIFSVLLGVFFPVVLILFKNSAKLPLIKEQSYLWLFSIVATIVYFATNIFWIIKYRAYSASDTISVTRKSENIQENINPNDIFFKIQKMVYDRVYYKKYAEIPPELKMEGSDNKGTFKSMALYELMEKYIVQTYKEKYKPLLVLNHSVLGIGVVILFINIILNNKQNNTNLIDIFLLPTIIIFAASILISILHNFLIETYVETSILWVETNGTYMDNHKTIGNAMSDSLKQQSFEIRTKMNYYSSAAKLVTSSFGIDGIRTILEITENAELSNSVENAINDTIVKNKNIDRIKPDDIDAIKEYQELNTISHLMKKESLANITQNRTIVEDKSGTDKVEKMIEDESTKKNGAQCGNCNSVVPETSKFCPNCGSKM